MNITLHNMKYAFVGFFLKSLWQRDKPPTELNTITGVDNMDYVDSFINVRNIRQDIINSQGYNKKILDIGCGLGFSTSSTRGSLGIDNNLDTLQHAMELFPRKQFQFADVLFWESDNTYDVVTSMFYFHRNPRDVRQKIIQLGKTYADERVVIVDLAPGYIPNDIFSKRYPHLQDYLDTCSEDLSEFTETVIEENKLHVWTLELNKNKEATENEEVCDSNSVMKLLRFYRPM